VNNNTRSHLTIFSPVATQNKKQKQKQMILQLQRVQGLVDDCVQMAL